MSHSEFTTYFIIIFVIVLYYFYSDTFNNEVKYVISTFDNQKYLVRNKEDSNQAADLLAKIKQKLVKMTEYLNQKYTDNTGVKRLAEKFNPNSLSETGKYSSYTSYSVNKGEKIVLCLRSRDKHENLVDENTLTFVALHELAHIMTVSVGHTREFWKNFKFILKNAIALGIYKHVDYSKEPQPYCGITVSDTPLTDNTL